MKYAIGALFAVAVMAIIMSVFLVMNKQESMPSETPTAISQATSSSAATPTSLPSTSNEENDGTGSISGKLCYPSEFLPAGMIEAKNIFTNTVEGLAFAGSEGGGKNTYTLDNLPAGNYILRYRADVDPKNPESSVSGYHTDTCPTGLETTCKADNPRQHISVVVTSGKEITGIDLCDFYYSETTEPGF